MASQPRRAHATVTMLLAAGLTWTSCSSSASDESTLASRVDELEKENEQLRSEVAEQDDLDVAGQPATPVSDAATTAPSTTQRPTTTQSPATTQPPTTTSAPPTLPDDEFLRGDIAEAVCRGEGSVPGADPYDPATPGPHQVLVLVGGHPGYEFFLEQSPDTDPYVPLPDGWAVDLDDLPRGQLIACVDGRDGFELVQVCEGYGDDRIIEIYEAAEYHVSLYAAATGELISAATITGSESRECPMLAMFGDDELVQRWYDSLPGRDSLTEFLAPHVEP